MEALRELSDCTRRGAWVGASKPINFGGVAARTVGGPGGVFGVTAVVPVVRKPGFGLRSRAVSAQRGEN